MVKSRLRANQHYINHYMALHKTRGVLTIARKPLNANHSMRTIKINANHKHVHTIQVLTIIY